MDLRTDGPEDAALTVLLAHGAGAGMDSPFLQQAADGLAGHCLRVVRFEFPYMALRRTGERRAPDPPPRLIERFREVAAAAAAGRQLALAGKSLGGRIATMVADELQARAVVVFGYPFHPPGRPQQLRTGHLRTLRTPTLILQGERDPFGTRAEVESYDLSPALAVHWLADGDHSLAPRKSSGHTAAGHVAAALTAAAAFLLRHAP